MGRQEEAELLRDKVSRFLDQYPELREALEAFNISFEQYEKALRHKYRFYSSTSTVSPETPLPEGSE